MKPSFRSFAALLIAAAFSLGLSNSAQAAPRNTDKTGKALQGYDPVAFFTEGKAVKGKPLIHSAVAGATYYFSSEENKVAFDKNPTKYEPQFGGWCAYGVTQGSKVEIEPEAFQVVDGRLLLQYSKGIRDKFNKDTKGNLKVADAKWPEVSKK